MTPILETIVRFFEEEDWHILRLEEEPILQAIFRGESGEWPCYAIAHEEQQQFAFYSLCPVHAPEEMRMAVAECITRANHHLIIGNFELDFEDGEIRYKTSIDVEGDRLSLALIQQMVYANLAMMDHYLPGIMAVLYGGVSPAEAIAEIEGSQG
jgi:hypothetical protein